MDYTNQPLGLRVQTQIPLNVKEYKESEDILKNLGTNNNLAFTYEKGLIVYCIQEGTRWEWTEVKPGLEDTGLITQDFIYPDGHIAFDIDYSNKRYNFIQIISIEQNNFVRQILINKEDIEVDNYYDINNIINYILNLPEEDRTIVETTSKVNIIIYQAGEGGIQPYETYELQNIGKGLITELLPENLLRFANDELQTFQDVLARGTTLTSSHFVTIPTEAKFEMFVGGFGGNFILSDPSLEPDFPNALIGRGYGNISTENSLSFYSNRTVFKDSVNSRGIEYVGDYEANFTARSLITKRYLESETNKQKVVTYPADFTGTNYTLTNADNNYEIIIDNGATAVTITVPSGLMSKIGVGFTQKGTADVSYTASGTTINNPIGLKIKGQYYQTYLSQESLTNIYYLGGNTKV